MTLKEIKFSKSIPFLIIFSVIILLLVVIIFFENVFFEEYESYFTTMLSGELTPGTNYNHLYYFGQIGLSFFYAFLYSFIKFVPWIPLFYELVLSITLAFFIKIYFSNLKKSVQLIFILLIFIILHEHFLILNITRISFVIITLGTLILLNKKISKKQKTQAQCILIFGILTRPEPAFLTLFLLLTGDFILNQEYHLKARIQRWLRTFWPSFLIMGTLFVYFQIDFKTSNEFYKQIEPDVEYELMVRQNFVSLSRNTDSTYLLRYQAINNGFWGDSKMNNNLFLRSLIDKKGNNNASIVDSYFFIIKELIIKNSIIFYFLILLYIFSLSVSFKHSKREFLFVNLIVFSLLLTTTIVAIQVKMVDRGFVSLLTITCFIFLLYLKNRLKLLTSKLLLIPVLVFSVLQIYAVQKKLEILRNDFNHNKKCLKEIKPIVSNSEFIFLGQSSMDVYFHSQTPFGTQTNFKNIYIFNALAFVTSEPYRSYLEKKYKCNPNDYKAFFEFASKENCVFLLNKSESSFLESYLRKVHKVNLKFVRMNQGEFTDESGTHFYAFKLLRL